MPSITNFWKGRLVQCSVVKSVVPGPEALALTLAEKIRLSGSTADQTNQKSEGSQMTCTGTISLG